MNRVKTREYVFKLLFCNEFHNVEEMPKQCSLFLDNLENASELLRKDWIENPSNIPNDIREILQEMYPDESVEDILEKLTNKKLKQIISKSSWVLHESIDLETVILVPRIFHDKVNGYNGISHMGGVSLAKYVKQHMGSIYFERFISAAASGFVIGN